MPPELVVALCVAALPFGAATVNVTLAPEAGIPPLITEAVIGTVFGRVKLAPETERLAATDGGVTTVALAVSVPVAKLFDAFKVTM